MIVTIMQGFYDGEHYQDVVIMRDQYGDVVDKEIIAPESREEYIEGILANHPVAEVCVA